MRSMPSVPQRPKVGSGRWLLAAQVGQFALAGLIALAIVGLATAVASRRVGEREAVSDARTTTVSKAKGLVEPAISNGLLDGDAKARRRPGPRRPERRDRPEPPAGEDLDADGRIIYSDEPRLIGRRYRLGDDEKERDRHAAGSTPRSATLDEPENRYERALGQKLLEVYLPVHAPNGDAAPVRGVLPYTSVQPSGTRLWRSFAPITLGALVAARARADPARVVAGPPTAPASARAGSAPATRRSTRPRSSAARSPATSTTAWCRTRRRGVRPSAARPRRTRRPTASTSSGRPRPCGRACARCARCIVDLYPPNLREEGLASALQDLTDRPRARCADDDARGRRRRSATVPDRVAGLLYRAAQEGLRNVVDHAHARDRPPRGVARRATRAVLRSPTTARVRRAAARRARRGRPRRAQGAPRPARRRRRRGSRSTRARARAPRCGCEVPLP